MKNYLQNIYNCGVISLYIRQQTQKPVYCAHRVLGSLAAAEPLDVWIYLSAVGTSAPMQCNLLRDVESQGLQLSTLGRQTLGLVVLSGPARVMNSFGCQHLYFSLQKHQ